jgi:hypothetical protein
MVIHHILYTCYLIIHLHLIMLLTYHRSKLQIINSIILIFDDCDDYRKDVFEEQLTQSLISNYSLSLI